MSRSVILISVHLQSHAPMTDTEPVHGNPPTLGAPQAHKTNS